MASSDNEIVEHLKARWTVQPLVLDETNARMELKESNIDVSDRVAMAMRHEPPHDVPSVRNGLLEARMGFAHDVPPDQFKQRHEANMLDIRTFIQRGSAQVATYNQQLDSVIRSEVDPWRLNPA